MKYRKLLSIIISAAMTVGLLPVSAGAAEAQEDPFADGTYVFTDEDFSALDNDVFAMIEAEEKEYAAEILLGMDPGVSEEEVPAEEGLPAEEPAALEEEPEETEPGAEAEELPNGEPDDAEAGGEVILNEEPAGTEEEIPAEEELPAEEPAAAAEAAEGETAGDDAEADGEVILNEEPAGTEEEIPAEEELPAEEPADTEEAPVTEEAPEEGDAEEEFEEAEQEAPEEEPEEILPEGDISILAEQDYIDLLPEIIETIQNSETYVEGTLQQNGTVLVWETTCGIPCCYDPYEEALENNPEFADAELEEEWTDPGSFDEELDEASLMAITPDSMKVGLIMPYYESEDNNYDPRFAVPAAAFDAKWSALCQKTGSSDNYRFTMDNATIDNIASTIANCGIVLIHTHGATDYNNGNGDRTSRANTSYMTVKTSAGLTSADVAKHYGEFGYYYDCLYSEGYARFNGECIAKHMPKNAPSGFVYLGMCLGMATDGLCTPLRNKGVEALMGFSQIVRISTDYRYMQNIADCLIQGTSLSYAVQQSKENVGYWDPALKRDTLEEAREARAAFPIVASSEDPYPGHGNADDYQTVNSTWKINKNLNFSGDAVINTEALVTDELSVTLTGNAGYFSDSELTFQWQQYYPPSGGSSGFWGNISGATGRKYTCSSGLAGKYIHVVVKAPGYSGQITSNYCYISGSVLLSSDNFPDAVFRNYLSSNFDKDHDGSLSVDPEITAIRKIDLSYTNAASLVGLRYLVNVTEVNANGAGITSFDGTGSPKLRVLKLYNCPLGSLDLNDNPNLTEVNVSGPNVQLSTLDLSGHRNLVQLYTSRSGIGTIDISDCPLLTEAALYGEKQTVTIGGVEGINYQSWNSGKEAYLSISGGSSEPRIYVAHFDKAFPSAAFRTIAADTCGDYDGRLDLWEANGVADLFADHREEGITSLQGIEFFPNLYQLSAKDCRIEYVDLSSNHRLTDVDLSENSLVELDVSNLANLENLYLNDNKLYYIDVSENPALRTLEVAKNDLIKVDVSHNPILYTLDISENDINEIDISMLPELQYLYFGKTKIAEIDLSENTDLYYLDCIGAEKLKKLNVTDNEALEMLFVQGSGLKSLNLSENPLLSTVKCYSTQISRLDISNNPRLISAYQGSYSAKVDSDLHTAYYEYTGGSISECLAVDFHTGIATKDIRTAYISSIADKTYTGSAIRPAVDVFWDGYELTKGTDYKVTYSNNINAGTATVKVTGLNDYAGSLSRTFKIRPKKVTPKVTLSPAACTWNGNVRKPGVKVTAGSTTLVKNTDYTVTYAAGRKNVGTYKVTVKLKGNYSGSGTASFKINPKGTTVGSLTALTGGIKVKWTPQTASMSKSKVGGYQVQFATDSAFTANKKTTTVTGYKRASLKKTGLKSGKKYYVRIRTFKKVDGKTYYSSWSKAKTVKTK